MIQIRALQLYKIIRQVSRLCLRLRNSVLLMRQTPLAYRCITRSYTFRSTLHQVPIGGSSFCDGRSRSVSRNTCRRGKEPVGGEEILRTIECRTSNALDWKHMCERLREINLESKLTTSSQCSSLDSAYLSATFHSTCTLVALQQ